MSGTLDPLFQTHNIVARHMLYFEVPFGSTGTFTPRLPLPASCGPLNSSLDVQSFSFSRGSNDHIAPTFTYVTDSGVDYIELSVTLDSARFTASVEVVEFES